MLSELASSSKAHVFTGASKQWLSLSGHASQAAMSIGLYAFAKPMTSWQVVHTGAIKNYTGSVEYK